MSNFVAQSKRRFINSRNLIFNEVVHKSLVVLADQALFTATNFVTGLTIARACGRGQFGIYALAWSLVLLGIEIQSSLILSPYTAFEPRLHDEQRRLYMASTMIHQILLAFLSTVVLIGIALFFSLSGASQQIARSLWALVVVLLFILFRAYARQVCLAQINVNVAFLIDLTVALIQIGGLLMLVHTKTLLVNSALYMVGCACGVPSLIWIMMVRRHLLLPMGQVLSDLKRNMSFGKWVLAGNLCVLISSQLYPWLVNKFHGIEITGTLAACMGVIGIFNPLWAGIGNIIGPRSSHAYAKLGLGGLNRIILGATILLATVSGSFSLIIFFWGDEVMHLLYGPAFEGNGTVLSIMSLAILASALTSGIDYGLWAVGETDKNFKANVFSVAIAITLGPLLVKFTGLLGVGMGMLIANGGASMIRYVFYRRMKRTLGPYRRIVAEG